MHKIEKGPPFSATLTYLDLFLILPGKTKNNSKFLFIRFWVTVLGCIVCCILPFHHLIISVRDNLDIDISEDLSVSIGSAGALTTSYLFVRQVYIWLDFIHEVTDFETFGKPHNFEKVKATMNLHSTGNFLYLIFGLFTYGTVAYRSTQDCKKINEEMGLHELCGSLVPINLYFDANPLMFRVPIFLTQFALFYFAVLPGSMLCFLAYESTEILLTHSSRLKICFTEVFDTSNVEERSRRLRFCINYHNHILRLIKSLNHLVKYTDGHMTLISAIVFACMGNQIFKTKPVEAAVYLVGYVVSLFWICHAGQRITDETLSINAAVYESKWYEADAKTMKTILLILMRSQKPATLDALPLGAMNYSLFLMIFKTSYSYLTLLNQST